MTLTGTFTTQNGQLQDPTNPQCKVVDPAQITTTYSGGQLTHLGTGVYTVAVDTTAKEGRWQYLWFSPGPTGQAAGMNEFFADPFPQLAP